MSYSQKGFPVLFHLFLTREYDGTDVTDYVGAFQSETSALTRASRLIAEYVGSSVLIQEEDESENVVSERVIYCRDSYKETRDFYRERAFLRAHPDGKGGYPSAAGTPFIGNARDYVKLPETLQSLGLEPGDVAYVERVDRRRLIVHTTDGRVLRAYDVDRDVTA